MPAVRGSFDLLNRYLVSFLKVKADSLRAGSPGSRRFRRGGRVAGSITAAIEPAGLLPGIHTGAITVTPPAAGPKAVEVTVTVYAAPSIVTDSSLPVGIEAVLYGQTLAVTGGQTPYT